jgi:hypothetical protein
MKQLMFVIVSLSIVISNGCAKRQSGIEVITEKKFSNGSCVYLCYTVDSDFYNIEKDIKSLSLFVDCKNEYAYIYNDKSKIVSLTGYNNFMEALGAIDGAYIATYIDGTFWKNETTLSYNKVEKEKKEMRPLGELKIIELENKTIIGNGMKSMQNIA